MVKRSFLSQDYKDSSNGCDVGNCCGFSSASRNDIENVTSAEVATNPDVDVAAEWNQLSPEERNQVYEDIHGVFKPIPETPELLHRSLAEMQVELDKQARAERLTGSPRVQSYDKALAMGPSYVENPKFRLAFLRSERFDAAKSAERFFNYFDLVEFLFGEELLCRDITQDDLGPKEKKELLHGHIQFLLQRDAAGRAVQFLDPISLMEIYSADAEKEKIHTRACLYLVMRTVLDSVETQQNGTVSIVYGVDTRVETTREFKFPKPRFLQTIGRCFRSVPLRFNSMHFLSNDIRLQPFMYLFQFAVGRIIRARFQSHHGAATECKYALMTYGLPVASIPTNEEGVITYTKHAKSLEKYRTRELALQQEALTGKPSKIDWDKAVFLPNNNDILLGRGRPYQDFAGNVKLRDLIAMRADEYDSKADRGGKTAIALEVVKRVQSLGGRFLKLDETTGWWLPVSDKEAKGKVSQGFRKKREKDLANGGSKTRAAAAAATPTNVAKQSDEKRNKIQVVEKSCLATTPHDKDESKTSIDGLFNPLVVPLESDPLDPECAPDDIINAEEIAYMLEGGSTSHGVSLADPANCGGPLVLEEEKIDRLMFDEEDHNNPASSLHDQDIAIEDPVMMTMNGNDKALYSNNNDHEPLNKDQGADGAGDGEFLGLDVTKLLSVLTGNDDENAQILDESKTGDQPPPPHHQQPQQEDPPLLAFLHSHQDSLKCTPQESFHWLQNQDIMTLCDLREACLDEDFLELEFKAKGGLKGFKRRHFVKAVVTATMAN